MSDPTPDPQDDVLRAALEAEADDVVAGPELLDRIRAEAVRPHRRRLAPRLLVAAALVAVVGIGAVLLRDDDQVVDLSEDPTTTTSSTTDTTRPVPDLTSLLAIEVACEQGEALDLTVYLLPDATEAEVAATGEALAADPRIATARYLDADEVRQAIEDYDEDLVSEAEAIVLPSAFLVDLADGADENAVRTDVADRPGVYGLYDVGCLADPSRPTVVALVREDGWLVTVDLATGEERELYFGGDPSASSDVEEGGPQLIDAVELSPDGEWIYFSTCCEPAVGMTYRIPFDGGDVETVGTGASPRVSPDGQHVATGGSESIFVHSTAGGPGADPASTTVPLTGCCARSLAWSPDGTQLAVVTGTGAEGDTPQVLLFDWDGTALTPKDTGKPDNPGWFVSWTAGGTLNLSSGGPIEDDRSLSQDATYGWLLWVDEAGVVREQAGHEAGDRPPVAGLPEALTADW